MKVVLDTNVFISAILTRGNPRKILEFARKDTSLTLFISEFILWEIERILKRKIGMEDFQILTILDSIRDIAVFVSPNIVLSVIERDDSDNRILECAIEAKAEYIVSGDDHLLLLKEYNGIKILTPSQFINIFPLLKK